MTPDDIQIQKRDTLFLWRKDKVKRIAQLLTIGRDCEIKSQYQDSVIMSQNDIIIEQDSLIKNIENDKQNLLMAYDERLGQIDNLREINYIQKQQLRRNKRHKKLWFTGSLLLIGAFIIK